MLGVRFVVGVCPAGVCAAGVCPALGIGVFTAVVSALRRRALNFMSAFVRCESLEKGFHVKIEFHVLEGKQANVSTVLFKENRPRDVS